MVRRQRLLAGGTGRGGGVGQQRNLLLDGLGPGLPAGHVAFGRPDCCLGCGNRGGELLALLLLGGGGVQLGGQFPAACLQLGGFLTQAFLFSLGGVYRR